MVEGNAERRLAAVVAIDVAGYSRLMGADEDGTLAALKGHREATVPLGHAHGGRVVGTAGDGELWKFPSVIEAVTCIVEVQALMVERNAKIPDEEKMLYRIGINLGDVMIDGDDIYGEGINVAARLEALADPGGICVSRIVRDSVRDRTDIVFEDLGEVEVKNIARPVEVFRVVVEGVAVTAPAPPTNALRRKYAVAAAIIVAIVAAGGAWWWQQQPNITPADPAKFAFKLPDKPSIAVLPFQNMSGNPEQAYFADGMAEDIITDLSKLSGLFVISRNSSFKYRGDSVDVKKVGRELGVKYVLEGSVRRDGDQVRINAQLIDALSGGHLWAERYDGTLDDVFALQDKVTKKIVAALAINLTAEQKSAFSRGETVNPQAHDALLRGWAHFRRDTPEDLAEAVPYLKQALELDPTYRRAQAALAAVYWRGRIRGEAGRASHWQTSMGLSQPKLLELTRQYLRQAMVSPVPLAYQVASGILVRQGRFKEAIAEAKRAIALDGNDPAGYEALASALIYAGRPAEGIDVIGKAMRLDPRNRDSFLFWLGLAEFGMEKFDQAAKTLQAFTQRNPDDDLALLALAASYGHLGLNNEARHAVELVNRVRAKMDAAVLESGLRPGIDVFLVGAYTLQDVDHWQFKNRKDRERMRLGLQKSGVPSKGNAKSESPVAIAGATTVDVKEAKALFDRGVAFIDVRGNLWTLGRIPGATHLFLKKNFNEQSLAAAVGKNEEAVFYCGGVT